MGGGMCAQKNNGSGKYPSMEICKQNCKPPNPPNPPTTWNCVGGGMYNKIGRGECVQNKGTTPGQYNSLDMCKKMC